MQPLGWVLLRFTSNKTSYKKTFLLAFPPTLPILNAVCFTITVLTKSLLHFFFPPQTIHISPTLMAKKEEMMTSEPSFLFCSHDSNFSIQLWWWSLSREVVIEKHNFCFSWKWTWAWGYLIIIINHCFIFPLLLKGPFTSNILCKSKGLLSKMPLQFL